MLLNKNKTVTVRVSEQEYDILQKSAKMVGLSISSYVRMCGLKDSKNA